MPLLGTGSRSSLPWLTSMGPKTPPIAQNAVKHYETFMKRPRKPYLFDDFYTSTMFIPREWNPTRPYIGIFRFSLWLCPVRHV